MSTAGFILPKVNFLSVTMHGGAELPQKTDEPHISQASESDLVSASVVNASNATYSFQSGQRSMKVEVLLSIEVGFNQQSAGLYASFFQNFDDQLQAYLKIRIVQSLNPQVNIAILDKPQEYFKSGGIYDQNKDSLQTEGLIQEKVLEFAEYEGNGLDLDMDSSTNEGMVIEKKYTADGSLIYVFPYKVNFEVPESNGGIEVQNLAYFAHAYIDAKSFYIDNDIFEGWQDLPDNIIDNLSIGELNYIPVIQGGSTSVFGQIFYVNPTGEDNDVPVPISDFSEATVWTGPVHYHDENNPGPNGYVGYMSGYGGADMGAFLTPQPVFNGIIQDFREVIEIEKINYDYSLFSNSWFNQETTDSLKNNKDFLKQIADRDNPSVLDSSEIESAIIKSMTNSSDRAIFTDMYTAMDGSGNTRFVFGINVEEALMQNSVFPRLVKNIFENGAPEDATFLLNNSHIEDLRIYRTRVYEENVAEKTIDLYEEIENQIPKLVVCTKDNSNGNLISVNKQDNSGNLTGTIRATPLTSGLVNTPSANGKIRFFTGTDLQTPSDGDYNLSVEMIIKDPIILWMEQKILRLERVLYGLPDQEELGFLDYVEDSKSNPAYFNLSTNRFTQAGIEFLNEKYGSGFINTKIYQFFEVLSSFSKFDESIYGLYNFLTALSSMTFGNPSGALKSFQVMETTYKKILNVFSSASKYKKPEDSQHVESQYSAGSSPRGEFLIKKKFSNKIMGEINHLSGYDYLSQISTTEEDSPPAFGLSVMGQDAYEQRTSLETQKLFSLNTSDYNIEIPKKPLTYTEATDLGPGQILETQGPTLNSGDTISFSKHAYLSPSIVNFQNAANQPLLNNGNIRTDIKNLNNTLINIIRLNVQKNQNLDFPGGVSVATGVGDQVIKKGISTESKFDLLSIMALKQTTVSAVELLQGASSTKSGIMGGIGSAIANLAETEISLPSITEESGKDIFTSNIDPSMLLLTLAQQNLFKILEDQTWTWEYYVENFDETFFKEFLAYGILAALGGGTGGAGQVPSQSPLTRAPNHLKCLMSNLDYTKNFSTPAFQDLIDQIKVKKPYLFSTKVSIEDAADFALIGDDGKPTGRAARRIVYQTPEFASFFILNFKNIVKIEALAGYETDENGTINVNAPIWKLLTQDNYLSFAATNSKVLCRLVPYYKNLYGIKEYEFLKLPIYNEHFIIDFAIKPMAEIPLAQGAQDQQGFDTSPFLEPDSQETLPGGQTTEQAEALVGAEGGAFGIGVETGLSAGAFTELGGGGLVGGAAGGPDVGTGGGFLKTMLSVGGNSSGGGYSTSALQNAGSFGSGVGAAGQGPAGALGQQGAPQGDPVGDDSGAPLGQFGGGNY